MNHQIVLKNVRDEAYATLKNAIGESPYYDAMADLLCIIIDAEDEAAGVDISERHTRRLYHDDVIALYEARERE